MFEWLRRAFGSTWLLAAALVVLLPVLAVLQYRWLERLGRWERDRTLAILQAGADHAAEVFDREIACIYRNFQLLLGPLTEDRLAVEVDLALQRIASKTALDLDALITDVLWLPPPDLADRRPLRFDRSGMCMTACDRPPTPALAPPGPQAIPMVLLAGKPALVISQPTLRPRTDASQQVVVIFDDRVLIDGFLAPLVERFLGGDAVPPMAGAVVPADGKGEALYRSDPALSSRDFAQYDVAVPILRLRNDMLMIINRPSDATSEAERKDVYDRPDDPAPANPGTAAAGPGGGWQLRVKHPAGSVASAVAAIRLRNQLIGFGILALLAAAMVLLMVSTRRAQKLARLQLDFVGSVSHELRTPLAVITAAGENLADAVVTDSERLRLYGRLIRREGTRLGQMVDSVLQFSRLRSERPRTEYRPLQMDQLVARAVEGWKLVSEDDDCSVEFASAARVPAVLGDEQALLSAVQNLIGNAVKHGRGSQRQPVAVNVVAEGNASDGNSAQVNISICDHGPGIPDSERETIFEPFRRGKLAMENQTAGSGLGLSLVLRAARAHGGRISLISEPGRGSTFTLHLPAATDPATREAP